MEWEVGIPGKDKVRITIPPSSFERRVLTCDAVNLQTSWEGGVYKLVMLFPEGVLSLYYHAPVRVPHIVLRISVEAAEM